MKKIIICLLACLVFVNSAFVCMANAETLTINENFAIRNGITFRASASDIENVESANKSSSGAAFSEWITDSRLSYRVTLAGHEAELFYWTDEENIIKEFQYLFVFDDAITAIRSLLNEKYGQPNYNYGDWATLFTKVFAITTVSEVKLLDPTVAAYDGWMLQYNDCWVLVEFCKIYIPEVGSIGTLNYYIMSTEDAQNNLMIQENIEDSIQQAIDSDL